jgi:molybdate transport system substrate-binding protein
MRKPLALFFALIFVFSPGVSGALTTDLPQITILAASSMSEPITELVRVYSKKSNIIVTASFDGTAELAEKIEQGEQADVFIASHPLWMQGLKQRGLIDVYSLTNIAKNRLVLVGSKKSRIGATALEGKSFATQLDYLSGRSIMVMGDFDNSALGLYTKGAILNTDKRKHTKLWGALSKKIIPSPNSKNALYLITHGETAGIIYYSDAYNNKEVSILSVVDESLHEPVVYQAAVVAGENMGLARDFLKFLQSGQAKDVYKKYGFIVD